MHSSTYFVSIRRYGSPSEADVRVSSGVLRTFGHLHLIFCRLVIRNLRECHAMPLGKEPTLIFARIVARAKKRHKRTEHIAIAHFSSEQCPCTSVKHREHGTPRFNFVCVTRVSGLGIVFSHCLQVLIIETAEPLFPFKRSQYSREPTAFSPRLFRSSFSRRYSPKGIPFYFASSYVFHQGVRSCLETTRAPAHTGPMMNSCLRFQRPPG